MVRLLVVSLLFLLCKSASSKIGDSKCIGANDPEIVNGSDDCPDDDFHADQNPDLYQGDIVGIEVNGEVDRNALREATQLWPKKGKFAEVPYVFDSIFGHRGIWAVQQAIEDFNKYTCVRFIPRSHQKNYLRFTSGAGCSSNLGMSGGPQFLSLGGGCQKKGIAIHEMIHAVGFLHEQARPDRDQFVTIQWQNIQKGREPQFEKGRSQQFTTQGITYDYSSVMHYNEIAFSKNGRPTIVAMKPITKLGQRRGFSKLDIAKVNKLYNCDSTGKPIEVTRSPITVPPRTNPPKTNPPKTNPPVTFPPRTNPPNQTFKTTLAPATEGVPSKVCVNSLSDSECERLAKRRASFCKKVDTAQYCASTCKLCEKTLKPESSTATKPEGVWGKQCKDLSATSECIKAKATRPDFCSLKSAKDLCESTCDLC